MRRMACGERRTGVLGLIKLIELIGLIKLVSWLGLLFWLVLLTNLRTTNSRTSSFPASQLLFSIIRHLSSVVIQQPTTYNIQHTNDMMVGIPTLIRKM